MSASAAQPGLRSQVRPTAGSYSLRPSYSLTDSFIHTYIYSKHTVLVLPYTRYFLWPSVLKGFSALPPWPGGYTLCRQSWQPPDSGSGQPPSDAALVWDSTGQGAGVVSDPHGPLPACRPGDALPPLAELGATEEGNLTQDSALSRESSDINEGAGPGDFEVLWELLFSKVLGSTELKVLGCFTSLGRLVSFS